MTPLPKFNDPRLSLWQSSVATVLHRELGATGPEAVAQVVRRDVM
jgi:hypothetical protein